MPKREKRRPVWPHPASSVERDVAHSLKILARRLRRPVTQLVAESINRLVREADEDSRAR